MFSHYKRVGVITDGNPIAISELGGKTYITASIYGSFQVYRTENLSVCLTSKALPVSSNDKITNVLSSGLDTFVAVGSTIYRYEKARISKIYEFDSVIQRFLLIGRVLLAFDINGCLTAIDTKSNDIISSLQTQHTNPCVALIHPNTYVNKVILAFSDGSIELWNFKSKKLVYTYQSHQLKQASSHREIGACYMTPDCNIMCISCINGDILFMDLKLDMILLKCHQSEGMATCIAFRTYASSSSTHKLFLTSTSSGTINIWTINTETNTIQLKASWEAHKKATTSIIFLESEPIVITASEDNSIKMWIYDSQTEMPKLLRYISGYTGYPTRIRFLESLNHRILGGNLHYEDTEILVTESSMGSIRTSNLIIENKSRLYSMKHLSKTMSTGGGGKEKGLPEICDFDVSHLNDTRWPSMVTIHKGLETAYIWNTVHKAITKQSLTPPITTTSSTTATTIAGKKSYHKGGYEIEATAVAVTSCGNFCIIGYKNGLLHKFNMQSGHHRGVYDMTVITSSNKKDKDMNFNSNTYIHKNRSITGVFIDISRRIVVSCSIDQSIIFWDFTSHTILSTITHTAPCSLMRGCKDTGFVAIADHQHDIHLYNVYTYEKFRIFKHGHTRRITEMIFSADRRLLLSSSIDTTIRIWELTTGRCVSWLAFDSPVMSIALSPSNEYLCVGVYNRIGLQLCLNRSLYQTMHYDKEPDHPTKVDEIDIYNPSDTSSNTSNTTTATAVMLYDKHQSKLDMYKKQLTGLSFHTSSADRHMIQLSHLPRIYKTKLFHYELLRKRNEYVDKKSLVSNIPFFLSGFDINRNNSSSSSGNNKKSDDDLFSQFGITRSEKGGNVRNKRKTLENTTTAGTISLFDDDDFCRSAAIKKLLATHLSRTPMMLSAENILEIYLQTIQDFQPLHVMTTTQKTTTNNTTTTTTTTTDLSGEGLILEVFDTLLTCIYRQLIHNDNFEILQAILYRIISDYDRTLLLYPQYESILVSLKNALETRLQRMRFLLETNQSVLRMINA